MSVSRGSDASLSPDHGVNSLPGVGPKRERQLRESGISTIRDLLFVIPTSYEDRRVESRASDLASQSVIGQVVTVSGRLREIRSIPTRRRSLRLTRASFGSDSGEFTAVWFNRPYLSRSLERGTSYRLTGKLNRYQGATPELANASVESSEAEGRVVPIYPRLGELGPAFVGRLIEAACERVDWSSVTETIPPQLLRKRSLPEIGVSLRTLHRPTEDVSVEHLLVRTSPQHRRLVYGDLLEIQLVLAAARRTLQSRKKRHEYRFDVTTREALKRLLPFRLTGAQRRVFGELVSDMRSEKPMLRLLQGDVGSGKTIVALLAAALACESGIQCAFMVPTELLAEQHLATLEALAGGRYRADLLTSSVDGQAVAERLASGESQLVIGTHALIQESVTFEKLGLVIVDEQHRFGLEQRRRLAEKGADADLLVMTATPIPRTMALLLYGDLDLSVIDELPPRRSARQTRWLLARQRDEVLGWLRQELDDGGQAYVVFPVIDQGEGQVSASLEEVGDAYRQGLGEHHCAVVTGRMKTEERVRVLEAFRRGDVRCLLSTTVIEVGVDVPGASAMVIEGAERFGLAQLHQLRGRIGRGSRTGYCFAIASSASDEAKARLEAFQGTENGFAIAEADLAHRGAGDLVVGNRQAGRPLGLGALRDHPELLDWARQDARELLASASEEQLRAIRGTGLEVLDGA